MKKYWEKIKEEAIQQAFSEIGTGLNKYSALAQIEAMRQMLSGEYKGSRILIKELREKASEMILAWDVRCWKDLRKIFPSAFPSWMEHANIELSEDGWVFNRAE